MGGVLVPPPWSFSLDQIPIGGCPPMWGGVVQNDSAIIYSWCVCISYISGSYRGSGAPEALHTHYGGCQKRFVASAACEA
jgi:hypothetical protein